uniref:Uncharacterized protein n=1 Tax=Glossina brevipalpis TaxID=37001 RepID=A0A1A9X3H7_9MUSC
MNNILTIYQKLLTELMLQLAELLPVVAGILLGKVHIWLCRQQHWVSLVQYVAKMAQKRDTETLTETPYGRKVLTSL